MSAAEALRIDLLRAALKYAEMGWWVFPVHSMRDGKCSCGRVCGRPGKHPRTSSGSKDASCVAEIITSWWNEWPDANIGIACGPSGLMVVDVDPRNDGDNTFTELEQRHGTLPKTLTANTGGGGQHYYFDVAGVDGRFKGRVLGQGIELQAYGQYVIAPPSNHASGGVYEWDFGQESAPVMPPPWLIDEETRKARYAGAVGAPLDCILGVAFSAAGMLGPALGPDRVAVACPWESDHSQGSRFDSSTIVFGPADRGKWGFFYCSHSHCKERLAGMSIAERNDEIMRCLPEKAVAVAKGKIKGADREMRKLTRADWERSLVWNDKGEKLLPTAGNMQLMMGNMPEWAGLLAFDEAKDSLYWTKEPPSIDGLSTPTRGVCVSEGDWIHTAQWFSIHRRVEFKKETAAEVILAAGKRNVHNSLTTYLEGLQWDGKDRLSTWLIDYCGAEDTPANRRMGRSWMISACARASVPGVQVDHVLVLEGEQGAGKSSVFRILGGAWYLGNLPRIDDKDARHILSGSWIVEIAELAAIKGSMIEKVKSYITDPVDEYRPPYARAFVKRPRRCVFGATTNDGEWNGDTTGARRFWPVRIGAIDLESLQRDRDQLWAEALTAYIAGESFWIPKSEREVNRELRQIQESREHGDPWDTLVEGYMSRDDDLSSPRKMISMDQLLGKIGIAPQDRTAHHSKRASAVLSKLGYVRKRVTLRSGERAWVYVASRFRLAPGDAVPGLPGMTATEDPES